MNDQLHRSTDTFGRCAERLDTGAFCGNRVGVGRWRCPECQTRIDARPRPSRKRANA